MRLLPVLLLPLALLAACGGSGSGASPAEALATAKSHLDTTSGLHLHLTTADLPDGVTAPSDADGVLTDAPAFDGTITLPVLGVSAKVAVVAVGGRVWAKLPFTGHYQQIDAAKLGVPDPSTLLDPSAGVSSLLSASQSPAAHGSKRGGTDNRTILTEYDATLPGTAVARIIHGAEGDFDAAYTIDDAGDLVGATLTGHFAGASKPVFSYTLTLSDYGTTQEITAP